jgi:hypothetical protein
MRFELHARRLVCAVVVLWVPLLACSSDPSRAGLSADPIASTEARRSGTSGIAARATSSMAGRLDPEIEAARAGLAHWLEAEARSSQAATCPVAELATFSQSLAQAGLASSLSGWAIERVVTERDALLPEEIVSVDCGARVDGTEPGAGQIPITGASLLVIDLADAASIQDYEAATATQVSSSRGESPRFVSCRVLRDPDRDSVTCRELMDLGGLIVGVQVSGYGGDITPDLVIMTLDKMVSGAIPHLSMMRE